MVYHYKHGFSGFAAKLTESQVLKLSGNLNVPCMTRNDILRMFMTMECCFTVKPGVVRVMPNSFLRLKTTRSWDFLGLSTTFSNNLLHSSNLGDGVIVGLLDSGTFIYKSQ